MGALVAVIDRKGKGAVEKALTMLKTLRHRFDYSYGIATENSVFMAKAESKLLSDVTKASAAVGYGLCKIKPEDQPQPILQESFALAFEGRLFPPKKPSDLEFLVKFLRENPEKKTEELMGKFDGSYSFAVLHKNRVFVSRDPFGTRPLYYGKNSETVAVASEMKALWKLGIKNVESLPPRSLVSMSKEGFGFKEVRKILKLAAEEIREDDALKILQKLLLESVHERVEDLSKTAVAFSGGVDSGTIAFLIKKCGITPQLVCVGLEERKELQEALSSAEELGLPLHVKTFNEEDVEKVIHKVLWLIEDPNPVKLSIAIPFYFTAETARQLGFRILFAGQGGDELFGGYRRYLQFYAEKGSKALENLLYSDFLNCYKTNFERDEKVCAFNKVELRLPFVDWELASFVFKLPLKFKVSSENDSLRKIILRKTMEGMGLPFSIAYKPKKAVQYATGVNAVLKKLAKRKGLSLRDYVKQVFNEIRYGRESHEENCNYL